MSPSLSMPSTAEPIIVSCLVEVFLTLIIKLEYPMTQGYRPWWEIVQLHSHALVRLERVFDDPWKQPFTSDCLASCGRSLNSLF